MDDVAEGSQGRDWFLEGLVCRICEDLLDQPRVLPCGHAFCFKCLKLLPEKTVWRVQAKRRFCPLDETQFCLEKLNGNVVLEKLTKDHKQSAPAIPPLPICEECETVDGDFWCTECAGFYCKKCQQKTHTGRKMKLHDLLTIEERRKQERKGKPTRCDLHQQEENLYCTKCAISICFLCCVDNHSDHPTMSTHKRGEERRARLLKLTKKTDEMNLLSFDRNAIEKSIQEKKKEIVELKKDISEQEKELTLVTRDCILMDRTSSFFDVMVKDLPLAFVSEQEMQQIEVQLSTSLGHLKGTVTSSKRIRVTIRAWGGGGGGESQKGGAGCFCTAIFDFPLFDELDVVVGQGGGQRAKPGYETNGGEGVRSFKKFGGGSSHVILKRTRKVILGAGGGGGGKTGAGTENRLVGQGKGRKGPASHGGESGREGGCSVMMCVEGSYKEEKEMPDKIHKGTRLYFGAGGLVGKDGGVILKRGKKEIVLREVGKHVVPIRSLLGNGEAEKLEDL